MSVTEDTSNGYCFLIWKIQNFRYCAQKKGLYLETPEFSLLEARWKLLFFPRGKEDENFVSFLLCNTRSEHQAEAAPIDFMVSLVAADGSFHAMRKFVDCSFRPNVSMGCLELKKRSEIFCQSNLLLPNDTLTVRCHIWDCSSTHSLIRQKLFVTQVNIKTCSIVLYIKDFEPKHGMRQTAIWSYDGLKLCVLRDEYKEEGTDKYLQLSLNDYNLNRIQPLFMSCRISVLDNTFEKQDFFEGEKLFDPEQSDREWCLSPFINISKIMANKSMYLNKNKLSLLFESVFFEDDKTIEFEYNRLPQFLMQDANIRKVQGESSLLHRDLHNLFSERILCDVTLQTGSKVFPAHKNILSTRSPVFRAMFEDEMKEKHSNVVDISDIEEGILEKMLIYVYTEKLDDLKSGNALKLYAAADKYQLLGLKSRCSSILISSLAIGNICNVLLLADMHQDKELQDTVLDFIRNHKNDIYKSDEWDSLIEERGELAAKTMQLCT